LLHRIQKTSFEVMNLGTGNGFSVLEVIKTFEEVTQQKLNYEITHRRAGDVPELYADAKLAEEKLNWKAERTLDEMIKSSWIWKIGCCFYITNFLTLDSHY